jgi:hypothetical protein
MMMRCIRCGLVLLSVATLIANQAPHESDRYGVANHICPPRELDRQVALAAQIPESPHAPEDGAPPLRVAEVTVVTSTAARSSQTVFDTARPPSSGTSS